MNQYFSSPDMYKNLFLILVLVFSTSTKAQKVMNIIAVPVKTQLLNNNLIKINSETIILFDKSFTQQFEHSNVACINTLLPLEAIKL